MEINLFALFKTLYTLHQGNHMVFMFEGELYVVHKIKDTLMHITGTAADGSTIMLNQEAILKAQFHILMVTDGVTEFIKIHVSN